MTNTPVSFNLRVSKVPLLNVRSEFTRNFRILSAPAFRHQITHWRGGDPIDADYIMWGGPPNMLLTWFLQRAIIGTEAYIPSTAFMAAIHYGRMSPHGRMSPQVMKGTQEPFSLGCQSAAQTYYNCVPGLVEADFKLKRARGRLWKNLNKFYTEMRNPLFHGSQLDTHGHNHLETLESVLRAFELFVEVYSWLDWWFPPTLLNTIGAIAISEVPRLDDDLRQKLKEDGCP